MRLNGLSSREAERSRKEFGLNTITQPPLTLPKRIVRAFEQRSHSVNDEMPFSVFYFQNETFFSNVKVVRDGNMIEISPNQVVVGDMILLQKNDVVPADGTVVHGQVLIEQAVIDLPVEEKFPVPERVLKSELPSKHAVYCGTVVLSGEAYVYVNAIGDKTLFAKNFSSRYRSSYVPKKVKELSKRNIAVSSPKIADLLKQTNIIFMDKAFVTEKETDVGELVTGDLTAFTDLSDISFNFLSDIVTGIGINNSAVVNGKSVTGGNRTDRALMRLVIRSDAMGAVIRKSTVSYEPFDTLKRISKVKVRENGHNITYLKGSYKEIISKCSTCIDGNGSTVALNQSQLLEYIGKKISEGFQPTAVAKGKDESQLTLICVAFIGDKVKTDVIRSLADTGIQLVFFTGAERENAVSAAEQSGLLSGERNLVLTSKEIQSKSDEELKTLIPNLRVLAEVSPTEKAKVIRLAKESGLTVGVLIENAEDYPSAKVSDIRIALKSTPNGVKEYANVILNDDLSSLIKIFISSNS